MQSRIPTLDGWRGMAVLVVLIYHYELYFNHSLMLHRSAWFGEHGVTIFFVVSGFLITTTLLRAERIDIRRFYVRRFFRLMPAAWVYLATLSFLAATTHRVTIGNDLWGCLFFYRNFLNPIGTGSYTGHFWSLSMEEQFYLAWPCLLAFAGRRVSMALAVCGAVGVALYRTLHADVYMVRGFQPFFATGLRVDAILVGCLLAFVMSDDRARRWIANRSSWIFCGCVPVLAFDVWRYQSIPPLHEDLALALMIASTITNPRLLASRVFENSHLKTTGQLCYGTYLWAGLFFRAAFGAFGVIVLPVAVGLTWVLIEKPSQRLGDRILNRAQRHDLAVGDTWQSVL